MAVNQQQIDNLVNMLDGYVEQGGHHLNVNVFTKETLLDAQKHPEKHLDLIVRMCGLSVYFVNLSEDDQKRFEDGVKVENRNELNRILMDYES